MKQTSKQWIPVRGGKFMLHGYDTERDMRKAKDDIERMLVCLSQESLYEVMRFLAPYREKAAKRAQAEYDDFTKS